MLEPSVRIKQLVESKSSISIDPSRQVIMYYRSGPQMVSRAEMYLNDGDLEAAYVLYFKFIVLFVEHIRKHPNFNEVPAKMKEENKATLKDAMEKAELLKVKLKDRYTREYEEYQKEQERERQLQEERLRLFKEQEERRKQDSLLPKNQLPKADAGQPSVPPWDPSFDSQPTISNVNFPIIDGNSSKPQVGLPQQDERWQLDPLDSKDRTPKVDRSTKPPGLSNSSQRLKNVVVPSQVFGKFQNLALRATQNNIETCGILAGRSVGRDLVITHVLVPKQVGTSNSCAAENEEEVFDYQDHNHLITLGWIHTHPSQTAFLSSVDLHTHCPYQLMMPEAVAIVVAPKYKQDCIFSLTPDYGLDFIAKCRQTGFHPHPSDPPLFMEAEHVTLDSSRDVEIVDLRR